MLHGLSFYKSIILLSTTNLVFKILLLIANALSRKYSLLTQVKVKVIGFEILRELYKDDSYFKKI